MILTLLAFALILGLLIFVHEMGHFLVARMMGVKAEEFGFGFPPRIFGVVYNKKYRKWEFVKGNKPLKRKNTIYSLNWIPLGGFVKIFGENGLEKDAKKDSSNFANKPIWQRTSILAAGVAMNFLAAALILSVGFKIGLPEAVEDDSQVSGSSRIHIVAVAPDSPAYEMQLKPGDEITQLTAGTETVAPQKVAEVVSFLGDLEGEEMLMEVKRGDNVYRLKGTPRENAPLGEGALGITLTRTEIVAYPLLTSLKMGFVATYDMTKAMLSALGGMIRDLISDGKVKGDVAGPVGIVVLTNQMAEMGFIYLLQFAAILSINLAIINILPIPALDGGRILFLIVEKIKGSPVSQAVEQRIHLGGFYLLIALMIFITVRDVFKFQDKFQILWEKIVGIF
ncbi:MAG: RIP metalloprotease RseP [Patescibacteria group bacterium]|nr:RIP metalloprotease RseP [Patescibacteria group bacterium]